MDMNPGHWDYFCCIEAHFVTVCWNMQKFAVFNKYVRKWGIWGYCEIPWKQMKAKKQNWATRIARTESDPFGPLCCKFCIWIHPPEGIWGWYMCVERSWSFLAALIAHSKHSRDIGQPWLPYQPYCYPNMSVDSTARVISCNVILMDG